MSDTTTAIAVRPLTFDNFRAKKGDLCSVLHELPDGMGGFLWEVMFADGIRRFVRKDEVELTTQAQV